MPRFIFHFFLIATCISLTPTSAQAGETPIGTKTVEREAAKTIRRDDRHNIITAVYENDLIGSGRDGEYTSGVRLSYIDVSADFPDYAHNIADVIPTFDINATSSIFYSVGQNIFTPRDVTQRDANRDDRPWAGFLYTSVGMATLTDNHTDELEITLGMVGPAALGQNTQKFIHSHITDSPTPRGWRHELKNEPGFMLAWQRAFPAALSGEAGPLFWTVAPHYGVTLGNIYTFANTGLSIQLRPESSKWQDTPVRVRPALPGTGFFEIPEKRWSWYLFAGVDGRAVGRNIFLDGNSFTDSARVDKNFFVADSNAGIALTYDQFRISYTMIHRTKEFHNQQDSQIFGAISVGYRF
ncbi:MAG: lipid A deacylase LpxR family protein [Micavibrio sp.]